MAITFVQKAISSGSGGTGTTVTVTISSSGAGNLICGWVRNNDAQTLTNVKDNNGNTFTLVDNVDDLGDGMRTNTFYMKNVPGGATSVIATFSASTNSSQIAIQEWSGVDTTAPLDGHAMQTSATTSGNITTTANGDLIFGCCTDAVSNEALSPGTGFTIRNNTSGSGISLCSADESQIQTTAGVIAATFSGDTIANIGIMAFKAATGGGGPPPGVQNNDLASQGLTWATKFPDGYGIRYRTWEKWQQQTPTVKTTFGGNYPWPNPQPVTWYQSWERRFELTNPNSQYDWPNPPRTIWYQTWTQGIPFGALQTPFNQDYWPNPQPITWYQSWTQSLNTTTLFPIGQNPFVQTDWPNPQPIYWNLSWIDQGNSNLPIPTVLNTFRQNDWPNPQPVIWYRDFNFNFNLPIPPSNPTRQSDWPNPQPITWDRFWSNSLNLLPKPTPFLPLDWPNPPRIVWDRFWSQGIPFGAMQKPFGQSDWPNPPPISWYQEWHQALAPYLPTVFPFSQTDWPNPKTWTPIDQWWYNCLTLLPQISTAQPFNQTDWPLPRDYQRIDESFWLDIINNFPPPPPPVGPIGGGRQIWSEELDDLTLATHKWHQRLIDANVNKTGEEIRKIAQTLGSLGGKARAESLTPIQRTNIASKAAQTRWQSPRR